MKNLMDIKSFQQMAADLSQPGSDIVNKLSPEEAHLWHMVTGISGEAGELLDSVKKHVLYKKPLDRANVVEELGDLRFYMAGLMNGLDITEEEILLMNNEKLSKRYSSGSYSHAQAIERVDKNE
jgi:NTP pyrophosphatase (non-canonical NTP hydrolase)